MSGNSSKELEFARILERVRRVAREQGNCISQEQVREEFAPLALGDQQLDMVFDYLKKHKISIGEQGDPDAFLTDEEKDYLQEYLDELEELPVYSQGETEAYAALALAGDRLGQEKLTESCLRNVAEIAKLYAGQGVLLEDLVGEGNVALASGIEMLGAMRESGAVGGPEQVQGALVRLVMDAMERHIEECAVNHRADKRAADKVNQVADKARELAEQLRRKVTPEELAQETGMPLKAIEDAMRMSGFKIEDIG